MILVFFIGAVNAADNVTNDATTIEDDEADLEVETSPISDLDTKIKNADANTTIDAEDDYTLNDTSQLIFSKSVTLQGHENKTVIEGNDNDLTLKILSDRVEIRDFKFTNIRNLTLTSHLMLVNCSFENVKNLNGTGRIIHLDNCEFTNTTLNLPYIENSRFTKSEITLTSRNFDLKNSSLSQCYIDIHDTELRIIGCTVADNTRISQCSYYLKIINSTFENNSQTLSQYGRRLDIFNSSFINNVLSGDLISYNKTPATITNSRFINNTCNGYLLNFGNESSRVNVTNSIFENNTCDKLLYWSYSDFNQYYGKKTQIIYNSMIEFSNNIIINNYDNKKSYSKIHIEPKIATTSGSNYYGSNITVKNNFMGFNMEANIELTLIPIFEFVTPKKNWESLISWTNVNLKHAGGNEYYLAFENKTDTVTDMPETEFSIKDKNTGEILLSNIKINEKFNLTSADVYILNDASKIINKPKAEISIVFKSFDYENIHIQIYLKDGNKVLKGQTIALRTTAVFSSDNMPSDVYYAKTNSKGYVVGYKTGTEYDTVRYLDYTPEYFKFTASFANEYYGLTKITYNHIKIKKTQCSVGASNAITTYKTSKKIKITLKNKKMKTAIEECYVHIYIYKGVKRVHAGYDIVTNGKLHYKMPTLKAGTYKVKITSFDVHYSFTKKTTFKVKKAKTKTKAPKVSGKYRKSKLFKVHVKRSGKPVKYVNVKIKLYTGHHYKIRIIKTNRHGVAKYNIKNMKIGKHKVIVTSHNKNYSIYKKSWITIK